MSTATQLAVSSTAPTNPLANFDSQQQAVQEISAAYNAIMQHTLPFGKVCYDWREKSEVVQGGTTFNRILDKAGVPRRTAYYWIVQYEISIALRTQCEVCHKWILNDRLAKHRKTLDCTLYAKPVGIAKVEKEGLIPEEWQFWGTDIEREETDKDYYLKDINREARALAKPAAPIETKPEPTAAPAVEDQPEFVELQNDGGPITEPAQLEITRDEARTIIANKNGEVLSDKTAQFNHKYHYLVFKRDGRLWRFGFEVLYGKPNLSKRIMCDEVFPVIVTEYRTRKELEESGETVAASAATPESAKPAASKRKGKKGRA
jgi:hypothetical protein